MKATEHKYKITFIGEPLKYTGDLSNDVKNAMEDLCFQLDVFCKVEKIEK